MIDISCSAAKQYGSDYKPHSPVKKTQILNSTYLLRSGIDNISSLLRYLFTTMTAMLISSTFMIIGFCDFVTDQRASIEVSGIMRHESVKLNLEGRLANPKFYDRNFVGG